MVRASVCGIESAGSIPAIRPSLKMVVWSRGKTGACKALNGGSTPPTAFVSEKKRKPFIRPTKNTLHLTEEEPPLPMTDEENPLCLRKKKEPFFLSITQIL